MRINLGSVVLMAVIFLGANLFLAEGALGSAFSSMIVSVDRDHSPELVSVNSDIAQDLLSSFEPDDTRLRFFKGYLASPTPSYQPDVFIRVKKLTLTSKVLDQYETNYVKYRYVRFPEPPDEYGSSMQLKVEIELVSPDSMVLFKRGSADFFRGYDWKSKIQYGFNGYARKIYTPTEPNPVKNVLEELTSLLQTAIEKAVTGKKD